MCVRNIRWEKLQFFKAAEYAARSSVDTTRNTTDGWGNYDEYLGSQLFICLNQKEIWFIYDVPGSATPVTYHSQCVIYKKK